MLSLLVRYKRLVVQKHLRRAIAFSAEFAFRSGLIYVDSFFRQSAPLSSGSLSERLETFQRIHLVVCRPSRDVEGRDLWPACI